MSHKVRLVSGGLVLMGGKVSTGQKGVVSVACNSAQKQAMCGSGLWARPTNSVVWDGFVLGRGQFFVSLLEENKGIP